MIPEVRDRIEQIRQGIMPEGYKKTKDTFVPAEWRTYRIRDFATVSQGFTFKRDFQGNSHGNWNYFKVADIGLETNGKYLTKALNTISDDIMNQIGCVPFKAGSIVFPRVGAALLNNNKKLLAQDSIVDDNVLVLSVTNADVCDNEYIYYALQNTRLEDWCNSELVPVINSKTVNNHILHLPSVREQKKIAEILSTQDKAIALQGRKIEELKRFKKGCMERMFPRKGQKVPEKRFPGFTGNWEQRKLGDISDSYSGGTPTVGVKEYYGGTIPFIRSAEIDSDSTELYITEEGLKKSSARLVSEGDILYALYGATSGEVGRARLNGAINQAILVIRPSDGYDREYITQWLRKNKQIIIDTYLQGGQGNLSGIIIKNLVVQLPSQPEQEVIGAYFASLDHLITLHQRKLDEMQKQKKALMQLLLTGIVRVKT